MNQVQGLTSDGCQIFNLVLDDGTVAVCTLTYRPNALAWFLDISYTNSAGVIFTANGLQVTTFPNILRKFRNEIPFGLGILYVGGGEPTGQFDWINGNAGMYLLNQEDVASVELTFFPGN